MKKIIKYQNTPGPLRPMSYVEEFEPEWKTAYKEQKKAEDEEYKQFISTPYYKTHQKPTKEQWKQMRQKIQDRGTVSEKKETLAPIQAVNNYVGELKYDMSQGNIPKGKYTWPLAALATTGVGQFLAAPVTTLGGAAGGYLGGKAFDAGSNLITGKPWAENVNNWTGLDKNAAEITNPGTILGGIGSYKYLNNVGRRAVETAMRTSAGQDGIKNNILGLKSLYHNKDLDRAKAISKYILTGKKTGRKGYYNSLAEAEKNGDVNFYDGFGNEGNEFGNDLIDAFLYGKEIDPQYGMTLKSVGKDFGTHTNYVAEKYPSKAKNIKVYQTQPDKIQRNIQVTRTKDAEGSIETSTGQYYDAGGHQKIYGVDNAGNEYVRHQDIWKFNPEDYMKKWAPTLSWWKKPIYRYGLKTVDDYGTPVIARSQWKASGKYSEDEPKIVNDLKKMSSEELNALIEKLKNIKITE